jgi:hypothetical protein
VIAEQLLDGEAEAITRKVIELAKQGDLMALRLCLDRIVPPRRDRSVHLEIPALNSTAEASQAMAVIISAVARGELTPTQAADLSRVIETTVKAIEATEIERRVQILEARGAAQDAK